MKPIHIWPEEVKVVDGQITHTARVEDHEPFTLWFRTPAANADLLCNRAESFVAATVLLAMMRGCDLHVHAPLAPSFLRNMEEFQAIWSCWDARFRRIEIVADSESEAASWQQVGSTPSLPQARAISMFSGGVDSCYTVWRHTQKLCGRRALPIHNALMVEGFDPGHFDSAFARGQKMLQGMDINLIRLSTNLRFAIPLSYLEFFHGSALAACLLLFQESHSHGLIPATNAYHDLIFPYASNALTDPLLRSKNFIIEHDGAEGRRVDKLREIVPWPGLLTNLRVCNQQNPTDINCGHCEKCVRNILALRALGINQPPCFPEPLTNSDIKNLHVRGWLWQSMEEVLLSARVANIREPWVQVLDKTLRREKLYERLEPTRATLKRKLPAPLVRVLRAEKKRHGW